MHSFFLYFVVCVVNFTFILAVPKIYTVGDDVLRNPSLPVSYTAIANDAMVARAMEEAHEALENFRAENGFGRGIAAPQIGYNIRMIALNLDGDKHTLFNPTLFDMSDDTYVVYDDCFSLPNTIVHLKRHKHVSVSFINPLGLQETWLHVNENLSELLQHEVDHLNGVLAIDHASSPDDILTREEYCKKYSKPNDLACILLSRKEL